MALENSVGLIAAQAQSRGELVMSNPFLTVEFDEGSSFFCPSQNRARLFRTGLPVPDRRRVKWRPTVGRTAGSGDPRRTKGRTAGSGDPRRTKGRTAGSGDPRRTKQVRNESSRDQMAAKTNFAACQREGPPKIPHPSTGALWTMTGGPACRWIGQCRRWNMPCRDGPTPMRQCRRTDVDPRDPDR